MLDPNAIKRMDHLPIELQNKTLMALESSKSTTFNGRDLFDLIQGTPLQSFASHGYSHMRFSYPGVTSEVVDRELKLCSNIWSDNDLSTEVFIFPQNHEGFFDQLHHNGIKKVRGAEYGNTNRSLVKRVVSKVIMPPPLSKDSKINNVELSTGSLFYNAPLGSKAYAYLLNLQFSRGLKQACRQGGVFHLYNHPFNLSESPDLFSSYCNMLKNIARKRDSGKLEIISFSDMNNFSKE